MAKVAGAIVLIIAVVLLLAGLGAAGYAFTDEQNNQDQLISDSERTDQNNLLMLAGGGSALLGLVFIIVGAILLAVNRREQPEPTAAQADTESTEYRDSEERLGVANRVIGGTVLGILVLLFGAMLVAGFQGTGPFSGLEGDDVEPGPLQVYYANGTTNPAAAGTSTGPATHTFDMHPATGRITGTIAWTASPIGSPTLEGSIEINGPLGWQEVATFSGSAPSTTFSYIGNELAGAQVRINVVATNPFTVQQGYSIVASAAL